MTKTEKPARFRPSDAHRWLQCQAHITKWPDEDSNTGKGLFEAQNNGKAAHWLFESFESRFHNETDPRGTPITNEMREDVWHALDIIENHWSVDGVDCTWHREQKLPIYKYLGLKYGDIRGRADLIIDTPHSKVVIDFKYGTSPVPIVTKRRVSGEKILNPQLMCYLLGIDPETIGDKHLQIAIAQPCLPEGRKPLKIAEVTKQELLTFRTLVIETIKSASPEPIKNNSCYFCKAKLPCEIERTWTIVDNGYVAKQYR